MSTSSSTAVHLFAGAVGGTVGAVITCPLEVVKTRLQSSLAPYQQPVPVHSHIAIVRLSAATTYGSHSVPNTAQHSRSLGLIHCLRSIVRTEGVQALFKGLGPNLIGVAPTRAVYFYTYASSKQLLNSVFASDTTSVHVLSAACAGFVSATFTNPVWFVKTRLQLDQRPGYKLPAWKCARNIYREQGIRGFYKGITASYYGVSETVVHLVIYEKMKAHFRSGKDWESDAELVTAWSFVQYMAAAALSKATASCLCYPHEVARTRMREEQTRYHRFWQTLHAVVRERGPLGLYRGLAIQLMRQIPSTGIMMATYELVLYVYASQFSSTS